MYNHAVADPELARAVSAAAVVVPDSAGIAWALRSLVGRRVEQIPGIDFIDDLCRIAAAASAAVFLLGAKPGVAEAAGRNLAKRHPGLKVAGARNGYFTPDEEPAVIAAIRASRAAVLLVGMSVPRQEKWIASRLESLGVPVVVGVGGSFDVIAGALRRAPRWMRARGLEWLFRLLQQPWRITRMKDLPVFVYHVLKLRGQARTSS